MLNYSVSFCKPRTEINIKNDIPKVTSAISPNTCAKLFKEATVPTLTFGATIMLANLAPVNPDTEEVKNHMPITAPIHA